MQKRARSWIAAGASVLLAAAGIATMGGIASAAPAAQPQPASATATTASGHQWLTGYWHDFDNGSTVMPLSAVPAEYNLIAVAFADADPATPGGITFTLDSKDLDGYTVAQFKADIAAIQAQGRKVVLSVGGQNGTISVNNTTAATNFANSAYALMKQYGFDGVDIDLENGVDATYMSQALHKLHDLAGSGLIITMAPQTIDYQYTSGGYYDLTKNIADILTIVNTQFYNSGAMNGCDGKVYSEGSVDFITALDCIELNDLGLRPDQVGIGLPATSQAAGSGYVSPATAVDALHCLQSGTSCGSFTPTKPYGELGGVMTWSINWDATNGYAFGNTVGAALNTGGGSTTPPTDPTIPPTDPTTPPTDPTTPPTDPTTPPTDPTTPPTTCPAAWVKGTVYTAGDTVTYDGHIYTAKWWTNSDTPGAYEWGPWTEGDVCS